MTPQKKKEFEGKWLRVDYPYLPLEHQHLYGYHNSIGKCVGFNKNGLVRVLFPTAKTFIAFPLYTLELAYPQEE